MYRLALGFALAATVQAANAACIPILGTVQTDPDETCKIQDYYDDPIFLGAPNCFRVTMKLAGILPATGYAGLTMEPGPQVVQDFRQVLTARSTFSLAGTRVYTAEVLVQSGGFVTEQSIITGTDGRGLFRNVTGGFTVLGNSIGQPAQVRGQLCTP
ncbi:MAG TPA: hypothetical protein PLW81_05455 [Thiobacillaceae bacterium]|nr:hypothetical protein [Thiobacillaceae bacterium]